MLASHSAFAVSARLTHTLGAHAPCAPLPTEYKFGDLTKTVLSKTDETLTNAGRAVLNDEEYKFGDISKSVANKAGQAITGDESYQFGDLTRSVLDSAYEAATQARVERYGQPGDRITRILPDQKAGKFCEKSAKFCPNSVELYRNS